MSLSGATAQTRSLSVCPQSELHPQQFGEGLRHRWTVTALPAKAERIKEPVGYDAVLGCDFSHIGWSDEERFTGNRVFTC